MSLSESQAHALAVRFQHWDRDHNGYLEWSDMEKAVTRLGDAFGRAPDAPELLALTESCQDFWRVLIQHADVDRDGRINQDEYVSAFGEGVVGDPDVFDGVFRTLLANVVKVADVNGNGGLDQDEYTRLMGSWYNSGEADAVEAFRLLDTDGDGLLSTEELVRSASSTFVDAEPVLLTSPPRPR
jgi:Ca2+-binding EF-hand superfamily protein